MQKILLFCIFYILFYTVHSVPVDDKKLEEIQHQLLNPEENLISENNEKISENNEKIHAPVTKDSFPDRRGFVTGHRIPLELFPKETINRLKAVSIFFVMMKNIAT